MRNATAIFMCPLRSNVVLRVLNLIERATLLQGAVHPVSLSPQVEEDYLLPADPVYCFYIGWSSCGFASVVIMTPEVSNFLSVSFVLEFANSCSSFSFLPPFQYCFTLELDPLGVDSLVTMPCSQFLLCSSAARFSRNLLTKD